MSSDVRTKSRETNDIIKHVQEHGWIVRKDRNHVKLFSPLGEMVVVGSTPSDWRAIQNTIARIRRIDPGCFPRQTKKGKQ